MWGSSLVVTIVVVLSCVYQTFCNSVTVAERDEQVVNGDFLSPNVLSHLDKGRAVIDVFNALRVCASG